MLIDGLHIDYKLLRQTSPETARMAVLAYFDSCGGKVTQTARVFGITRVTIYDILSKRKSGDLLDRSKAPLSQPKKTSLEVEEVVIKFKNKTRLGALRLSRHLKKYEHLVVPYGTIRHILRRNKGKLTVKGLKYQRHKLKREFVDWYSAKPFEIVQMDQKFIRDHKALTSEQIIPDLGLLVLQKK